MKKLTTLLLALAAVSCSSDFTVEAPKGAAIEFENIFVENSTRATALTKENIQDFSVYGFVESGEKQGQIFDNTRIYRAGEQFKYDIEQYWIGGAQYYFTAIAPYQDAKWTYTAKNAAEGTIEFDNSAAAASQDLIFAYVKPEKTPADIESKPDPVSFNFRHLLSRVKFSFTNGFAADSNITLEVSGVKITNTAASGSITVSEGTFGEWTTSGDMTIVFGDAALENQSSLMDAGAAAKSDNYFLIPAARTYKVEFIVTLYQAGVKFGPYNHAVNVTLDIEMGRSYELKATLNPKNTSSDGALEPIEFTVGNIDSWVENAVEIK